MSANLLVIQRVSAKSREAILILSFCNFPPLYSFTCIFVCLYVCYAIDAVCPFDQGNFTIALQSRAPLNNISMPTNALHVCVSVCRHTCIYTSYFATLCTGHCDFPFRWAATHCSLSYKCWCCVFFFFFFLPVSHSHSNAGSTASQYPNGLQAFSTITFSISHSFSFIVVSLEERCTSSSCLVLIRSSIALLYSPSCRRFTRDFAAFCRNSTCAIALQEYSTMCFVWLIHAHSIRSSVCASPNYLVVDGVATSAWHGENCVKHFISTF